MHAGVSHRVSVPRVSEAAGRGSADRARRRSHGDRQRRRARGHRLRRSGPAPDAVGRRGHRAPALRSRGGQAPPPPPGRGVARHGRRASARSTSPRAIGCSCTGSSSAASTGAAPGLAASPRWSRAASRSSIHRQTPLGAGHRDQARIERHHDHAGAGLRPEVGRLLRQSFATLDHRLGCDRAWWAAAGRRPPRRRVARPHRPRPHRRRTEPLRRAPAGRAARRARRRTAGGAPARVAHRYRGSPPARRRRSWRPCGRRRSERAEGFGEARHRFAVVGRRLARELHPVERQHGQMPRRWRRRRASARRPTVRGRRGAALVAVAQRRGVAVVAVGDQQRVRRSSAIRSSASPAHAATSDGARPARRRSRPPCRSSRSLRTSIVEPAVGPVERAVDGRQVRVGSLEAARGGRRPGPACTRS